MLYNNAVEKIDRGRKGLNKGLPMGFNRLTEYLPNIQQETFYLLGSAPKGGKTALIDEMFMYNPFEYIQDNETDFVLDIDYYSFEIDSTTKIIKGICRYLFNKYSLRLDSNTILSRGKNKLSDEVYQKVCEAKDYFEKLEDCFTVYDDFINPTGIYNSIWTKASVNGKIFYKKKEIVDKETGIKKEILLFDKYIPHNPNRYWIIIIDHIALLGHERSFSTKQLMDKMSQYFVNVRNNLKVIPVIVQQLSFDSESSTRFTQERHQPTLGDFGDSRYLTRDANVVMTLYNPHSFKIKQHLGYDITKLGNYYRNLEVIVNRDGEPNINIGLFFDGKIGTFKELPKVTDKINMVSVYNYTKTL